jgi:hypothetical protein
LRETASEFGMPRAHIATEYTVDKANSPGSAPTSVTPGVSTSARKRLNIAGLIVIGTAPRFAHS